MRPAGIERPIQELYLLHPMVEEKLQFLLHQRKAPETQARLRCRQAVSAPERAATARFIIKDFIPEFRKIMVNKRQEIQILNIFRRRPADFSFAAAGDSGNFFKA